MDSTPSTSDVTHRDDLGTELRESALLLGFSALVTTVVTVAAQAALSLLG